MLFSKPTLWQQLSPFHKQSLWERYEPIWLTGISVLIIIGVSIGLKTAINHQVVGYETLYISPASYSIDDHGDFFMSQDDVSDHMSELFEARTERLV